MPGRSDSWCGGAGRPEEKIPPSLLRRKGGSEQLEELGEGKMSEVTLTVKGQTKRKTPQ